MATIWMDGSEAAAVGDMGFLVRISNAIKGSERYELRDRPPATNQSHQPRAFGWCGTWNDTSTDGLGVWEVARVAKNGRVLVARVADRERLDAWLDEYGYPELLDECMEGVK